MRGDDQMAGSGGIVVIVAGLLSVGAGIASLLGLLPQDSPALWQWLATGLQLVVGAAIAIAALVMRRRARRRLQG